MPRAEKKSFFKLLLRKKPKKPAKIEGILGFRTKNIGIYENALLHRSLADENLSNERLEFLGDAILNLIVSHFLFQNFKDLSEGDLTIMRSKLINRNVLNKIAIRLNFKSIIKARLGEKDKPKYIYGNALEAFIGAIYLDKGLKQTTRFVIDTMYELDGDGIELLHKEFDHKSRLLELAAKQSIQVEFETTDVNMGYRTILKMRGKEVAVGEGQSKKQSEQAACALYFDRNEK